MLGLKRRLDAEKLSSGRYFSTRVCRRLQDV